MADEPESENWNSIKYFYPLRLEIGSELLPPHPRTDTYSTAYEHHDLSKPFKT